MYIITSTSSSVSISLCHYLPNVCLCIPRRRNCRSVRNWNFSPQNHSLPRARNVVEGSKGCPNFIASPLPLSPPVLSFRLKQTNSFVKLNQFWIYQLWLFATHTLTHPHTHTHTPTHTHTHPHTHPLTHTHTPNSVSTPPSVQGLLDAQHLVV